MLHHVLTEADTRIGVWRIVADGGAAGPLAHGQCIGDGRVVPHLSIGIGVGEIHELGNLLYSGTCRHGHRGLAGRTALGCHQDHAVGATHTEHSRGGGILQDRDISDFIGVELSERALHTVDEHQRLCRVQRTGTTHSDDRLIGARHTRRLYHRHTGQLTLQGVSHTGHRCLQQLVTTHGRDSTRDGDLLLLTIGDDHHLLQTLQVGLQADVHLTAGLMLLRNIADVRELERSPL